MDPEENAEVELAEPAIEAADEPTNDNAPTPELAEKPAIETEQPAEELDTVEINGKQYQIPKDIKRHVMLDADYTQKSQATAATAKELAAEKERLAEQFKASEEELGHRANLRQVESEIERYQKYTAQEWDALEAEDPQGWNKHQLYFANLERQKLKLTGAISEAETKRTQEAQSSATKRIEETQEHAKKIKNWSPQMDKDVLDFAESKGFDKATIANLMSPAVYDIIRYAKLGEESEKRTKTAFLPTPPASPPLTTVGAKKNPPGAVDLASADMESYVSERKKQLERSRR